MNARRVHAQMRERFPDTDHAQLEWTNVVDEMGSLRRDDTSRIVVLPFERRGIEQVLVEVHRKLGGTIPTAELVSYLSEHHGKGEIRIADRTFSVLALLAVNGVAASWETASV